MLQGTWQEGWRQSTVFVPVHRPYINYMNLNMSTQEAEEEEEPAEEMVEEEAAEREPSLDEMRGDVMEDMLLLPVHNEDEFWDDNYMSAMTEAMSALLDDEDKEDDPDQAAASAPAAAAPAADPSPIKEEAEEEAAEDNCGQPCLSPSPPATPCTTASTIRLTTTRSGRFPVPPASYWPAGHDFDDMKLSRIYLLREIREKKMHCQARREKLIRAELERIYMLWREEAITEDRLRTLIIQTQDRVKGLRRRETSTYLTWEAEATRRPWGTVVADVDNDYDDDDDDDQPPETGYFWDDD